MQRQPKVIEEGDLLPLRKDEVQFLLLVVPNFERVDLPVIIHFLKGRNWDSFPELPSGNYLGWKEIRETPFSTSFTKVELLYGQSVGENFTLFRVPQSQF
ncbi:hypothetical protein A2291_06985 [candidate division WOR-1 bacterium RIFOXYB2_FULL_42_35]|uniref:Uncharacterized protein n=1 Tax=candidate division WOR-1 bacterium RIFOXYC2_FULL_41_25 TaxID=1802586 RepID=A0A1F4TRJ8_UNCSA|nr:MAG: hypothetical protein A2247_04825 [candidate division WOR-1 bacterium RIFOXYA2_FULL_41_14]OGC25601.1 MAG: hypothetical protein A2291_06985 [candidate division WOR-1 bacterium RIFOXYB2_FULL_42_35]OGC35311.1 MAG: hypothetical protein A2462_02450 [candidate division WOR-1 bacterium RIFOXYC2_FULL_41_25]OGC41977.1 MAG: hypothetical protein A2548_07075 [candidate division WOR-1 bacterium RIFOXYD2_FULL_41_8]